MPFRLINNAERWFQNIGVNKGIKTFDTKFDIFYLCLMLGLAGRNKNPDIKTKETSDLVDVFPKDYQGRNANMIIALFLRRELEEAKVNLVDKNSVNKNISQLIDPDSPSKLSDEGMKALNQYSYGGFDLITSNFLERPRYMEIFLPMYHDLLKRLIKEEK